MTFSRPFAGRVLGATAAALWAICMGATAPAVAHTQVQAALSLAATSDGSGRWIVATSSGLFRADNAAGPWSWQCSVAFGSGGKLGLSRRTFALGGDALLLEDQKLQRSTDGCTWSTDIAGVPNNLQGVMVFASGSQTSATSLWLSGVVAGSRVLLRSDAIGPKVSGAGFAAQPLPAGFQPTGGVPRISSEQALLLSGTVKGVERLAIRSQDKTWQLLDGPDDGGVTPLLWAGSDVGAGASGVLVVRSGADKAERLWVSTDGGKSWHMRWELPPGDPFSGAVWLPDAPTPTLLVSGHAARVLRSTDLGATFTKLLASPHAACLRVVAKDVIACTDNLADEALLMRSTDRGTSWTPMTCLGKATGAATCGAAQSVCENLWKYTLEEAAAQPGTCTLIPPVTVDASGSEGADGDGAGSDGASGDGASGDGASGDGASSSSSGGDRSSTSSGGGSSGGVSAQPPQAGCSVARVSDRTPVTSWMIFLLATGALGARRRRPRSSPAAVFPAA